MNLQEITQKFLDNPVYLTNGAGVLSKKWHCEREDIYKAKIMARDILHGTEKAAMENKINDLHAEVIKLKSEKVLEDGNKEVEYTSPRPLSKKEIEDLYGIDGISSRLSNYWNKQQPNGMYLVSAFVKCLVEDFYSEDQLKEKLKELFPDVAPYSLPVASPTSEKALFIYIADDHCGLVLKGSLYKKEYSGVTYVERLLKIVDKVKALKEVFEDVYVVNLGDELDGYNAKTTRYDHPLDSLSNKEQFDIYVTARRVFYDDLFSSGIGKNYRVGNLNNSNHTGLGFSYMATKAVSIYLETKYPQVSVTHVPEFITTITYGNHVINLAHGKDEKYMKHGWPLNLDLKVDQWISEYTENYLRNEGEDLNKQWYVSTIKADLHKFNMNDGKSGRYINVPSISSGSNWIEHNYGKSKPGALIETLYADSPDITSTPIWF